MKKRVVIVGGGFAGLNAAKRLGRDGRVSVTLLDRQNHHLFQPLLYQVAMAGLSPAEIAVPIRSVLRRFQPEVLMAEAESVDLGRCLVHSSVGDIHYDYLLLACGAESSYFGHDEWEEYAPGLKTLAEATEIRRRVLLAFEDAESEADVERQRELLTFIVVGGGPTGVELAGALGEISRYTLSQDFRRIDPRLARVVLIEAGPRLLPSFHESLAAQAARDLAAFGVELALGTRVTKIGPAGVEANGKVWRARTVLWAAGVKPNVLNAKLGVPLAKDGRVIVGSDLSVPGHPEVFVLGDQAYAVAKNGQALPGLAPVALQAGIHAAENILRDLTGRKRKAFTYFDKGQMATIGRKKAVVEIHGLRFSGLLAWVTWLVVHIFYLIGFRNRVFVLVEWAWSYLRYSRGARLIVGKDWRSRNA